MSTLKIKFGRVDNVQYGHSEEQEWEIDTNNVPRAIEQAKEWANEEPGQWTVLEWSIEPYKPTEES